MVAMAEEITEIADNARNDYVDRITADGEVERVLDVENIHYQAQRCGTRCEPAWNIDPLAGVIGVQY